MSENGLSLEKFRGVLQGLFAPRNTVRDLVFVEEYTVRLKMFGATDWDCVCLFSMAADISSRSPRNIWRDYLNDVQLEIERYLQHGFTVEDWYYKRWVEPNPIDIDALLKLRLEE